MPLALALMTLTIIILILIIGYLLKKSKDMQSSTIYKALEQTRTPGVLINKQNKITRVTNAACELLEVERFNVIGQPACILFNKSNCDEVKDALAKINDKNLEVINDLTITTQTGHCHVLCKFINVESMFKYHHKMLVFHDRTKIIDTIKQLEESERKIQEISSLFKSTFNDSFLPTIIIKENGSIVDYNKSFHSLIKKQEIELNQDTVFNILHINQYAFNEEVRKNYSFEIGVTINSQAKNLVFNLHKISSGDKNFILCQIQDITKQKHAEVLRKKLETQIKQSRKVEYLGELAGIISHEFNNALMPIISFSKNVKEALPSKLSTEIAQLDKVEQAANHVKTMINQIMEIKHIDFHDKEELNLETSLKQSVKALDLPKNINLSINNYAKKANVIANNHVLCKAIKNLIVNSIESIAKNKGDIILSINDVTFYDDTLLPKSLNRHKITSNKNYIRLEIYDNGCGISAENIESIFNPFFTTKHFNKQMGTGLTYFYNCTDKYHIPFIINSNKKGVSFILFFEKP